MNNVRSRMKLILCRLPVEGVIAQTSRTRQRGL